MVLGVTGGYCAGKDVAVGILALHGIVEINEDKIGHDALLALSAEVEGAFGSSVLDGEGHVDRKTLGSIVFSDPSALHRLESIVHPWMIEETKRQVSAAGNAHSMINAAILHRMGLHRLCDLVLQVEAPFLLRLYRAKKRDGHALREIVRRVRAQREHQNADMRKQFLNEKGSNVDTLVVSNGGSRGALSSRLTSILSDHGLIGR
jgi:dephospho-CoA kinase